jgi:hypothetical protein
MSRQIVISLDVKGRAMRENLYKGDGFVKMPPAFAGAGSGKARES